MPARDVKTYVKHNKNDAADIGDLRGGAAANHAFCAG